MVVVATKKVITFVRKWKKQSSEMNINATAVANYFVDLAERDKVELKQLGLMKRVYITHGFSLAIFDMSAIDPRFDKVEAWKNGPVIPSVYHSFKYNGMSPIKDKSIIVEVNKGDIDISTPELEDKNIKAVADMVWDRYSEYDDFQLVELLHRSGTPWFWCYKEGENCKIPDSLTKAFYSKLVKK